MYACILRGTTYSRSKGKYWPSYNYPLCEEKDLSSVALYRRRMLDTALFCKNIIIVNRNDSLILVLVTVY